MTEVIYTVRRKFQYLGRWYKPGERWEPQGGKFDKQIINARTLVVPTVPVVERKPKAPAKKKKTGGQHANSEG